MINFCIRCESENILDDPHWAKRKCGDCGFKWTHEMELKFELVT